MADEALPLGHLGQVSLTVRDLATAVGFYRDVLRLPHLSTVGQLAFFDCAGTRLFLDALPEAQGGGNSVLYFTVPEIESATEALRARGVSFEGEPHLIVRHEDGSEEWMAFFRDPDQNLLALMSRIPPAM
jgi:catechol 2,3-dioxygenase-like lactoylglutathione lyase family enzyme